MDNFTWAVVIGVALIILVAFAAVRKALLASSWSLADALSEDVTLTGLKPTGEPEVDATGKSLTYTKLVSSSSRLIALIGLIGILALYIGFGLVVLRTFSTTHALPDPDHFDKITNFLMSGVVMFAPYIANKISNMFDASQPRNL